MMNFRTEVVPPKGREGMISHSTPILLIGSCFAGNVGERLAGQLFDVTVNPFGPLYNPLSIYEAFAMQSADEELLVSHEGMFHHFMAHSSLSRRSAHETLLQLDEAITSCREAVSRAGMVIITLGTTRCFRLRRNGRVVANCHKQPASVFEESRLSLSETVGTLRDIVNLIKENAPEGVKILFTVSPVRYLAEGAHSNQLSKATLLLAVEEVCRTFPRADYFPAYEIMMDDLRDYRFYAEDMKHPSPQAVDYIYSLFAATYFAAATAEIAREAGRLTRRLAHKTEGVAPDPLELAAPLLARYPQLTCTFKRLYCR